MNAVLFNEQIGYKNLLKTIYGASFDKLSITEVREEIASVEDDIRFSDTDNQKRYLRRVLIALKSYEKYLRLI